MFEYLQKLLTGQFPHGTPLPPPDAHHALGALLVRVAKADGLYHVEELRQIDTVLAKQFDLNPVEAAKMRAACEKLEQELPDTATLTGKLDGAISNVDREATVAALWSVVFADGIEHENEDAVMDQVAATLGVAPDRVRALRDAARV